MKAVVTLSKTFFSQHIKGGTPTGFEQSVLNGSKIHTCRSNYDYWEKKIATLKEKGGVLSVRQWAEKPYRSSQQVITEIPSEAVGVQKLEIRRESAVYNTFGEGEIEPGTTITAYSFEAWIDDSPADLGEIAKNDGLSREDFLSWVQPVFDAQEAKEPAPGLGEERKALTETFAIIHFTKSRY